MEILVPEPETVIVKRYPVQDVSIKRVEKIEAE